MEKLRPHEKEEVVETNPEITPELVTQMLSRWQNFPEKDREHTVEWQNNARERIDKSDRKLAPLSTTEIFIAYKITPPPHFEQLPRGAVAIEVKKHFHDKRLPEGYGYKGGAARALLELNLGIKDRSIPRDIDIVRLVDEPDHQYGEIDERVAKEFMPDDFSHGNGVEVVTDQDEYFHSRDLTINEVLATDTKVFATRACLLDTIRNVIRRTEYERDNFQSIGPKMFAKILRFYSEAIIDRGFAEAPDIEQHGYEPYGITPFWISLNLERALERGEHATLVFIAELKAKKELPEEIQTTTDAIKYLTNLMEERPFHFRDAEKQQLKDERELFDLSLEERFGGYEQIDGGINLSGSFASIREKKDMSK